VARGLGLEQYETNFRDNKINAALLPRLTEDRPKDIGVSALGDRLQLLDAIAALAGANPLQTSLLHRQSLLHSRVPKSRPSAAR
jgi:hypothetical protein